ncbi:MAG TPA: right-handed parallel beta-helix repeat-containing protein [Polyangia bacterium]|jgi:hypothetical protein
MVTLSVGRGRPAAVPVRAGARRPAALWLGAFAALACGCSDGPFTQSECTPGATRCVDDGLETCAAAAAGAARRWVSTTCPAGTRCADGACVAACADDCAGGVVECEGDGFRMCADLDGDGCVEWGAITPCPATQLCRGGLCVDRCRDQCPAGEAACAGSGVILCEDLDGDGCVEWGPVTACAATQTCAAGVCVERCTDQCLPGAVACLAGGVSTCGDLNDAGCTEWGPITPCRIDQRCEDGVCVDLCRDDCAPGEARCIGDGYSLCQRPAPDACLQWGAVTACPADNLCSAGLCLPRCAAPCLIGQRRCRDGVVQSCADHDGDGCLDWGGDQACGPGLACQADGVCLAAGVDTFFASPVGNDAWSGVLSAPNGAASDGPLASLAGARDAVRRRKAAGALPRPIQVLLRGGVYRLTAPFELTPDDSGTAAAPITYASYPGERATLSGGRALDGWRAEGGRWTLPIPAVVADPWTFGALWIDGDRRTRARTPNDGYFYTAGPAAPTERAFAFTPGDLQAWSRIDDALVVVYHLWATSLHRIASLDQTRNVVTFTGPATWPLDNWGIPLRYHVENVPEALDAPGEWYLDRPTGVLSYLPAPGEDPDAVQTVAPVASQLLVLRGDPGAARFVEHLTFQDLRFEHTEWQPGPEGFSSPQAAVGAPAAIEALGARQVTFERCFIGHTGGYGLWWRRGSQDGALLQTEITDVGAGGVRIGEETPASSPDEEVARIRIDNCFIHDGGKTVTEGVGVWLGMSSFNEVTHNEISDFFYTGVSVGWSWGYEPSTAHHNLIAHNHIHHLGKWVLSDLGAVYTLGVSPGTEVLHNRIHDVAAYSYGGWGLYPDEGSSNIVLANNLVYGVESSFHQNFGADNLVANNIFAYAASGQLRRSTEEDHPAFSFQRNIVLYNNDQVLCGRWSNDEYTIDANLYWNTASRPITFGCRSLDEWQAAGHDLHSVVADPLFVDPEAFDFRLSPASPALGLGFVPFSLDDFGLYGDPVWVSRPQQISRAPTPLPDDYPRPMVDGFEDTPPGQPPGGAWFEGETAGADVRVTGEQAHTGAQSVKLRHGPGLRLYYWPNLHEGKVRVGFAVRRGPGAALRHEWRCWQVEPYRVGPSLTISATGDLTASGTPLPVTVPANVWVTFTVEYLLGEPSGEYRLTVGRPGDGPLQFAGLVPPDGALCSLDWLGFEGLSDLGTTTYLDDLVIATE